MSSQLTHTVALGSVHSAEGAGVLRWFRTRAQNRDQAIDEAQRAGDIRWQWRQVCEISGLGRLVFSPTGPTMSIPMLGRVSLGPPVSFTVRTQPGQLISDYEAAGPRIAAAMGAAGIRVSRLAAEWIVIELLDADSQRDHGDLTDDGQVVPFAPRPRGYRAA